MIFYDIFMTFIRIYKIKLISVFKILERGFVMKMKDGICHICLRETKLSFEHYPPKSCFNNEKVIIQGKIRQKGLGDYTLCEQCNNNTGAWYVPEYEKLVNEIALVLDKENNEFDSNPPVTGISFEIDNINPLLCAKQMLVIMCSLMSINTLKKLNLSNFLTTKFAFLDGKENFSLLVGLERNKEMGTIFKEPIVINGKDQAFCLHMYPFKIALILKKGYKISGYSNFNVFLESDIRESGKYPFNIAYLEKDIFEFMSNTVLF